MIVYMSGALMSTSDYEKRLWDIGVRSRCYSYYYISAKGWKEKVAPSYEASVKLGMSIFMDSGAHTFHQLILQGKMGKSKGDIQKFTDEYIAFCHKEKHKLKVYVTFDWKTDAKLCLGIQDYFEKNNLRPMPVFHGDTSPESMKNYLDRGYEEIGISAVTIKGNRGHRSRYFASCFRVLCDDKGKPRMRVHGLGVARFEELSDLPWYSVDSATWCRSAAYGKILLFDWRRQKTVLLKVTKQKSSENTSYWTFTRGEQRQFDKIIEREGFTIEQLAAEGTPGTENRALFNARIFNETAQKIATDRYNPQFGRLFI